MRGSGCHVTNAMSNMTFIPNRACSCAVCEAVKNGAVLFISSPSSLCRLMTCWVRRAITIVTSRKRKARRWRYAAATKMRRKGRRGLRQVNRVWQLSTSKSPSPAPERRGARRNPAMETVCRAVSQGKTPGTLSGGDRRRAQILCNHLTAVLRPCSPVGTHTHTFHITHTHSSHNTHTHSHMHSYTFTVYYSDFEHTSNSVLKCWCSWKLRSKQDRVSKGKVRLPISSPLNPRRASLSFKSIQGLHRYWFQKLPTFSEAICWIQIRFQYCLIMNKLKYII